MAASILVCSFKSEKGDESDMQRTQTVRTNRQSKLGLLIVFLVVLTVIIACGVRSVSLRKQSRELAITESQLEAQLEAEKIRTEDLVEKEKYMKTKKYIEDEAKNKLGLVNKDEIVIKPRENDD